MAGMLDAAICKALNLDPAGAVVTNHGGSIVSTTLKIAAKVNGKNRLYFVKTSADEDAGIMFAGGLRQSLYLPKQYHIYLSVCLH